MNQHTNTVIKTKEVQRSDIDVRSSYLCFPNWSQPIWTLLTGKPLKNEKPLINFTPPQHLLFDISIAIILMIIFYNLIQQDEGIFSYLKYILTPFFSLYFTGFFRKLQVVYGHHAIHLNLFKNKQLNTTASKIFTVISISQNEIDYKEDHLDHHRNTIFTTIDDADANLLHKFGIKSGKSKNALLTQLVKTIFSLKFHLHFLVLRIKSNFKRNTFANVTVIFWLAIVLVLLPVIFGFYFTFFVFLLPLTFLYQTSAILQFSTEHVWLVGEAPNKNLEKYAARCIGRFCGEVTPDTKISFNNLLLWMTWWLRTIFIHIPTRMAVLVGDLPAHDWHHLAPVIKHSSKNWHIAIYERQRAIDNKNSLSMENRECWGLPSMMDYVFIRMSENID